MDNKDNIPENEQQLDNTTPTEETVGTDKKKANERKAGWLVRDIFEWGETLVSAVIIIVFVFTFALRVTSVDGGSMNPTLNNKDQMIVTNMGGLYKPKHNDIVVLFAPNLTCNCGTPGKEYCSYNCRYRDRQGKDIIKRVVGVEGDTISIDSNLGIVYRNGKPLRLSDEDGKLIEDGHLINTRTANSGGIIGDVTIPKGHVFVMGDNRGNSIDSRVTATSANGLQGYVGMVDVNYVAGRAFFRVAGDYKNVAMYNGKIFGPFGLVN